MDRRAQDSMAMARTRHGRTAMLGLVLAGWAATAPAQVFDLPPNPSPSARPPVVGPADPENPFSTPSPAPTASRPIIVPTPIPARPRPTPTSAASATPGTTPSPRATAGRAPPASAVPASPRPNTEPLPQSLPPDSAGPAAPAETPDAAVPPPRQPRPYVPRQLGAAEAPGSGWLLWLLAAAGAALLGIGAWLAWTRHFRDRRPLAATPEIERPALPVRPAAASQAPAAPPASTPQPSTPQPPSVDAPRLALALEATRMSATLVNAVLGYRLAVTNNGAEPLRDVVIAGDMIAAHASRPASEQLGAAAAALPELHRIALLPPGDSVTVAGDIRLPLSAITPIRSGQAALFVPLARLHTEGAGPGGERIAGGGTFLVGQPAASARLQPFRLDLGPRLYSHVSQQLLATPV